ncbi:MAG: oligoendopeptidase F [Clostridia bacterium]|nr:oligoendopeptidase F [Clostridia bacterium]
MDRNNIDPKYKWDLTEIYKTDDEFESALKETEKRISAFGERKDEILSSALGLLSVLRAFSEISRCIEKLWSYAFLSFATDASSGKNQAAVAKVRRVASLFDEAAWFVSPSLIKADDNTLAGFFKECPALSEYSRFIERVRLEKPYILSDECEKLMSKLSESLDSHENIRDIFASSDLRFGKIKDDEGKRVELRDTNYVKYLMSGDRRVRRSAFTTLYKTYEGFGGTFGALYSGYVKEQITLAKMRGYSSSITASTFRDEVTPEIYNNLINSVREALPTLYGYYEMKRRVLGLSKLHMYDLYAPLISEQDKRYTYEEAVDLVLDMARVFGDEYYSTLERGLTKEGWVDVYPAVGKQGGAFSAGSFDTKPYILLNFNGKSDDVSTLAHEAGHSMHSYFSRKYNLPHNCHYTIFVAEVASTVNELLLAHKRLNAAECDEEKLSVLNGLMETYKGTLFRQTMFAEFERDVHAAAERGEPLTAESLSKHYKSLVDLYFGKDVVTDRQISLEWMRIPHFFSAFYVYKYATCISAASAIVKRIENEGEMYIPKYIEFLKCGGSLSPLDSLKVAGIDMRDSGVVKAAVKDFEDAIKSFDKIYNSIKCK